MGQLTPSLASFETGYPAVEQSGDKPLLARYLRSRGIAYSLLGRFPEALTDATRGLAVYRELNDLRGVAMILNNTCEAHRILGDLRLAASECEEAWRISRTIPGSEAVGLASLGPIAALQGNLGAARDYLEEAIRLQEAQNQKRYLSMSLLNIGPIYRQLGETDKAFATYERSLALARETSNVATQGMALFDRAALFPDPSITVGPKKRNVRGRPMDRLL
jgi:tetratricopeptide (TPR) repeat protein